MATVAATLAYYGLCMRGTPHMVTICDNLLFDCTPPITQPRRLTLQVIPLDVKSCRGIRRNDQSQDYIVNGSDWFRRKLVFAFISRTSNFFPGMKQMMPVVPCRAKPSPNPMTHMCVTTLFCGKKQKIQVNGSK